MQVEIEPLFHLKIGTHFFKIVNPNPRIIGLCWKFSSNYVQYNWVRERGSRYPVQRPTHVYAARTKCNSEFRFHRGQLQDFLNLLDYESITPDLYTSEFIPLSTPVKIETKLTSGKTLWDYQQEAKEFVIEESLDDNHSRLLTMPTGSGKTIVSLATACEVGFRTVIMVLPKYIDKWAGDVKENVKIDPKRIMLIQGSDQVRGLIQLAKEDVLTSDFIIISLKTIQNFFKAYELDPKSSEIEEYGCTPDELFPLLQAGTMIIDETHEHLHAVFKVLLYTQIQKVIALSATLMSREPFIEKIHRIMFPKEIRFDKIKMKKYIRVYAVAYQFQDMAKARIRTTAIGSNTYSQTEFEKSILRRNYVTEKYLSLINSIVKMGFIEHYKSGDKLAIYAGSIEMCTVITNYLKSLYKQFDIRRYVEDDPYENIIEADIRVTTVLSGGTAIDIPNLRAVIQTINLQSPVANLQVLGRLRDLKDPDHPVKFYYIYCEQIKKHVEYHRQRKELFEDRVASIKEFRSNILV